ncbi:hypothetical protein JQU17_02955 [Ponticoccus sp. SC2-23]|uniref:DUF6778 family protein n=1 Tax=Alexandriicola marinus TaxID=2081710 RepID=UPI000FDAA0D6|nr:DUF6778 family protein [Alexandriicola marinus]MBM1219143.1 hypothetical protein [Ponticoccus sp. SC6-9]MBM1223785.1 hypothetical protein [Ponticoccus sp. SC6-15]MBM1228957.1 hypothetical protein [Ponticoccus sp. SC6-38]MBM1232751.1 hypothetical protein [Ponticoccus sp. SC6-45]MBM1237299.1 hypothetical protein [Ponticoccus sp. SC6-49]MBM1241762.1 hypothetical protein [Ponticoccus sp. SC2-64]MBM1246275.1 hypothetical protein [Ponticoccus sp. SC6-42]MBM1250753.1 hypothetical protein [Ponti
MTLRLIAALILATGLSACATTETVSRNVPLEAQGLTAPEQQIIRDYNVTSIMVNVPRDLRVSENNSYYPNADIVWRGDPVGDRHAQIEEIFRTATTQAAEDIDGSRDVIAVVDVVRFHGVTERTRYSVGGVYNMVFNLGIYDGETGLVIETPRQLAANLPAPGGQAAVQLEQAGQTEKVRVLNYLTFFIQQELSTPAGV